MNNHMENQANRIRPDYHGKLKEPLIPFRYFVMFLVFMATTIEFSSRCVLNVAILAMVGNREETNNNLTNNSTQQPYKIHLNWNQKDQGIVLGAYFYTYAAFQIIAGSLTDKYNNVRLLALSQFLASLCTFITPLAAKTSLTCLVIVRMVLGLVHGTTFPTLYNLVDRWFSTTEISWAQSLLETGGDFGAALSMYFAAWISERNLWGGWPAAFYIIGIFNLIFTIVWIILVTPEPQSNRFVLDSEKKLLAIVVVNKLEPTKVKKPTPWLAILTSLPLWAVIISRGITNLAYCAISSKVPVYLESVLHFKLESNGLINASLYLAVMSSELTSGPSAKLIITKGWLSRTMTRKLFQSITVSGIALSLLIISYAGDRPNLIVICLILAMFSYGLCVGGNIPTIPEMAPNAIGTTIGFANALASTSGFLAPSIIGVILGDEPDSQSKWTFAFKLLAGFQVIALIFFNSFATTDPQSWGDHESDDHSSELKESQSIKAICKNLDAKTV